MFHDAAHPAILPWKRPADHYITANGYTVCRTASRGKVLYMAWPPPPVPPEGSTRWEDRLHSMLGCYATNEEARSVCCAHYLAGGLTRLLALLR